MVHSSLPNFTLIGAMFCPCGVRETEKLASRSKNNTSREALHVVLSVLVLALLRAEMRMVIQMCGVKLIK